ncbi:MAG: M20/M25/M40 family metallo-hydrolase [Candidatus Wallbacteria bacterium]|nr:M20/M25/M40 family metallo-hydrolase [Candidatus Wallbacteria bacterium]
MENNEITLLKKILTIRSLSGNEEELSAYLFDQLKAAGIESRLQPVSGKSSNLLARVSLGRKYRLVISAHLDTETVQDPAKWQFPPYEAQEIKGRIYGRGANDTKGCLAAFFSGLIESRELVKTGEVLLALTCREETDSAGVYALQSDEWFQGIVNGVLVGEPCFDEKYKAIFKSYPSIWLGGTGRQEIRISGDFLEMLQAACLIEGEMSEKYDPILGSGYYRVRRCLGSRNQTSGKYYSLRGEPRHGSGEKLSRNLAVDMLRLAFKYEDISSFCVEPNQAADGNYYLSIPETARFCLTSDEHQAEIGILSEKLGYTLSEGSPFPPPVENFFIVDRNSIASETQSDVEQDLTKKIKRFAALRVDYLKRNPQFLRGWQQPVNSEFSQLVNSSIREINGRVPVAIYRMGPSDANAFSADFKWEAVVFGTYGANIHSDDEWVSAESVTEVKETVKRIIQKLEAGAQR